MFSYLYSNWIYLILLLYSPKDNYKSFDDQISADVRRSDSLRPKTSFGRRSADNKCLDANRIQTFVKTSVENLIQKLQTIADNSTEPEVSIQSRISVRHVNILRQYLPQDYDYLNCEQLEEFEDSINEFIESFGTVSDDHKSGDNSYSATSLLTINVLKAFLYLSSLLLSALLTKQLIDVLVRRRDLFPRLLCRKSLLILSLISLVLLSIVWKWRQKYLIELSRKQCYVLATPEECLNRHSELSFVSWIRHYIYGYEQRRHDYYRAVTVDPFWEINPLTVISELLSDVIFTPLQPLGHNSGLFITSFFKGIPLYLVIPVFVFLSFCTLLVVLLIALWLLMPNRYSIRIPFLMTIQLDRNQALNAVTDNNNPSLPSVRKYQIKANVVNVYHSLGPNDPKFGQSFAENPIQFDESLTFETIKPISIPYSEVD